MDGSRGLFEPTEKTKYAFKELCKDNYVFIASGRNKALLPDVIKNLNPNGYILCNGAYGELNNKPLFKTFFKNEDIEKLKKYVIDHNGFYILESIDNVYCDSFDNKAFKLFMKTWGMALTGFNEYKNVVDDEQFSISMIGFLNEEDCLNMEESISEFCDLAKHLQFLSYDVNIKGIDKGSAVKMIIKILNVDYEDTYAFGDGINDIEMLQAVNHPIAMDNCAELLKTYNFEKTDDVLWDGFYNYLIKNKLIKPM